MKILLIGGCGYIGTRLYDELKDDYEINSVDLELFGKTISNNLKLNYSLLTKDDFSIYDAIILVAGNSSVGLGREMKPTHINNVDNFIDLLSKIDNDVKFIYASSSSLYSGLRNATENDLSYSPKCYYDLTKFEIDLYAQLSDKHYYGLRLGTVNGYSRNFRNDLMINSMFMSPIIKYSNPNVWRPILDIRDLTRAVKVILEKGDYEKRGIYNLASFNAEVFTIAKEVGILTNKEILEQSPTSIYDFSIDCSKFQKTFDFEFRGTIKSILEDLTRIDDSCIIGDRKCKN